MVDFLSLRDEVIELVGNEVMSGREAGLRMWCRATSTCKRLWDMQLPSSAIEGYVPLMLAGTVSQPLTIKLRP